MNWYNLFKKSDKKGTISFDFDNTLIQLEWSEDGFQKVIGPRMDIIAKMHDYHAKGYDVIIVTSRMDSVMQEVYDFVSEYGLPVSSIHNTNGKLKGRLLQSLNVIKHFDDCDDEIREAREYNIDAEKVF